MTATDNKTLPIASKLRRHRLWMSCGLAAEIVVLVEICTFFRRSWGTESIGIGVFVLALLIPSAIALHFLSKVAGAPSEPPRVVALLMWGSLVGLFFLILACYSGDHLGATVMTTGFWFQAVTHAIAAKRLARASAASTAEVRVATNIESQGRLRSYVGTTPDRSVVESQDAIELRIRRGGFTISITVPNDVQEWFVDVEEASTGAKSRDWYDYSGYDSRGSVELDRDMAKDLTAFLESVLRNPLRMRTVGRQQTRSVLEWQIDGAWKGAVPAAESGK